MASGAVIEIVSALFFTQTNKSKKLMTGFFDRQRYDRMHNDSLRLCESIKDNTKKSELKVRLSLFFAGISDDPVTDSKKTKK